MMNPSRLEDTSSDSVTKCLSELGPKPYSSVELMSITSNLLESNKVGFGGYGKVYKGQFPSGILVAVKVLENVDVVEETFMAEIRIMGKAFHRNLVKLDGYCFEDNMKALVYEYMENGSLDKILYEKHHSDINWEKLYGIAIETAKGLNYLHNDLDEQIIHYDIKAANVLLDKNFSAKITDFGLAKIMIRDVSRIPLTRTRGTVGYNAPETWIPGSQVSCRCDVYSFGMMMFEILGMRSNGVEENWFPVLVWKHFKDRKLEELLRDCGIPEKDKEKAMILSKVALLCAHHRPERRPSMMEVVLMLEKNIPVANPTYPFLPGQFPDSLILPLQEAFRQVHLEPARSEREWLNPVELELTTYASVSGGENNGPKDDGVTLPQPKSNVPRKQSPNILEEELAPLIPNKGMKLPTSKLVGKTTALKYSERILQWIANDEVATIGIHGMGGVGKTTILKDVHNHLVAERNCFDKIIWVTVSKDGSITKLQNDIAKELDFELSSEDDVLRRSRLLLQALELKKRVVLFLDDMWKAIPLDEIGIPQPTKENGCKLLLTTRLLDVCKRMGCPKDNTITVDPLPKDEALKLFMKKVDHVLPPNVSAIAEMVAIECCGLPLAIITVGAAMRGNCNITEWKVALNDLKDFSNRINDSEDDIVFERLKFSYDRLPNEKLRKCFLCCALYPEDYKILARELIEFWIMDGMFEGRNRQGELLEGQFILKKLKDHCLLESIDILDDSYNEVTDGVKMHDLVRDMALRITSKHFLVKAGALLKVLPKEREWGKVLERASFMNNEISNVSLSPRCPNLSTLCLGGNLSLSSITHNFFVNMQCLRVLDLRCKYGGINSKIISLPDSISDLVHLCALRLSWCVKLKKVPSLAKLILLRTLELENTGIEELPEGMEMLVNLKCLNLHAVELRKTIPMGLISKLSALQELYLGGIEMDKLYKFGSGETFAQELLSLEELENLNTSFHCFSDYSSYVGSSNFNGLKYFFLGIGHRFYYREFHLGPPPRATISYTPDELTAENSLFFPENTKRVEISLFNELTMLNEFEWFNELVAFAISYCDKLECIWSWSFEDENGELSGSQSHCWLQSLERIQIEKCPKVYTLFEGIPTPSILPFFCLKELIISHCDNLKNVFSSSRLLLLLQNLEEIVVSKCKAVEALIGEEEEENKRNTEAPIAILLPRLKELVFWNLPKLKSIWRGVMICDSLEIVRVLDCLELKKLPQFKGSEQSTPPPALKAFKGRREWWDSLEWDPTYPQNILQPFFVEWVWMNYASEEEDLDSQSDGEDTSMLKGNRHIGIVCDNCQMNPIVGKRYICKACYDQERTGFDLCEECYNTPSKFSDLVNEHHTQEHTFELIINHGDSSVPVRPDDKSQDAEDGLLVAKLTENEGKNRA